MEFYTAFSNTEFGMGESFDSAGDVLLSVSDVRAFLSRLEVRKVRDHCSRLLGDAPAAGERAGRLPDCDVDTLVEDLHERLWWALPNDLQDFSRGITDAFRPVIEALNR